MNGTLALLTEPKNGKIVLFSSAFIVIASIFFLRRKRKRNLQHNVNNGPPYKNWPLNKLARRFLTQNKTTNEWMQEAWKEYGNTIRFSIMGRKSIWTSDAKIVTQIFKQRETFPIDEIFRKAVIHRTGRSMFATEGDLWKRKHDLLQPMMKHSALKYNNILVHEKMAKLMEKISLFDKGNNEEKGEEEGGGKKGFDIEIVKFLKQVTLDVIGEFAFGVDFHALDDNDLSEKATIFTKIANGMLDAINLRLKTPPFLWWIPHPIFKREKQYSRELMEMFEKIFEEAKEKRAKGENMQSNNLLSIFLSFYETNEEEAKKLYPKSEMLGECFSIWTAGHDTTTYTSAHILKILSEHEDVQEKLRKEIMDLAQHYKEEIPSFEEINKLKYLDVVIKEVQRLSPIAAFAIRQAAEDVVIDGVHFPKNTLTILGVDKIQNSEEYFKDAKKFIPERWLDEENDYSSLFYAFGYGVRACFGKKLALMELKCLVYHFLQKYRIVNNSDEFPHRCLSDFPRKCRERVVIRLEKL